MEKAFNSDLKPIEKLVMLCLADNANNEGVCFPSINTIAQKSGLSKKSVIDNIAKLEDKKLLIKKYRSRKKGGRSSNKYLLFPIDNSMILSEEDYDIFKEEILNLKTQSEGDTLSTLDTQSEGDTLANKTQSEGGTLESEPSLNSSNHHLYKYRFTLSKITQYENLSTEYKSNLSEYANNKNLLDAMIDHHTANGKGFKDWSAAFRTWKRNDAKFSSNSRPSFKGKQPQVGSIAWQMAQEAKQYEGVIDVKIEAR